MVIFDNLILDKQVMNKDKPSILDEVEDTTSIVVSYKEEDFEAQMELNPHDYSFEANGEDYQLFNKLKKFVLDLRDSVISVQKNESQKLMQIADALKAINFKLIEDHELEASTKFEDIKTSKKLFQTQSGSATKNKMEKLIQERDRYKQELDRLLNVSSAYKINGEIQVLNSLMDELPGRMQIKKSDFNEEKVLLQKIYKDEINRLKDKHHQESQKFSQSYEELRRAHSSLEDKMEKLKKASIKKELYLDSQTQNQNLKVQVRAKQEEIQAQMRALDDLNEQIKRANLKMHQMAAENMELMKAVEKAFETVQQNDLKSAQKSKTDQHHQQRIKELTLRANRLEQQLLEKESIIKQLKNAEASLHVQIGNYQLLRKQNASLLKKKEEESNQHQLLMAQEKTKSQKLDQQLQAAIIQNQKYKEHFQNIIGKLDKQNDELKKQVQSILSHQEKTHKDESKNKQLVQQYQREASLLKEKLLAVKRQGEVAVSMQKLCQLIYRYFSSLSTRKEKEDFKRQITIFVGPLN